MPHRNGLGPDPALTGIEALEVCSTAKTNGQTFKAFPKNTQAVRPGQLLSDSPPAGKSTVPHLSRSRCGEESSDYRPVIATLNADWRVITCKNSIQWVLQKRRGKSDRWDSRFFFRTRAGLLAFAHEYAGQISGDALVILLRLPEWIGGAP
jgi:hypothetical protein